MHVLDITNDFCVPSVIAISYRKSDGKSMVLGLGSHLDVEVAVNRALAEMNQMLILEEQKLVLDAEGKVTGDDEVLVDWIKNKSLESERYCDPDGTIDLTTYERPRITDLKDAVEHCVRVVSDKGHDMIVLDHSRTGVDFSAARVVVPGMRHFWARFREGRLTKTPVEMGWRGTPLAEEDLNPIPFFL